MKIFKLTKIIVLFLAISSLFILTACHQNRLPDDDDIVDCEKNPEHESCKEEEDPYPYSYGFTIYELTNSAGEPLDAYAVGNYEGEDTEVLVPAEWKEKPVIKIIDNTFAGNKKITKVTIPSSVNQLGKNVFSNCTNLKEVEFGVTTELQKIPANTFYECTSLQSISIPRSVKEIGEYAFYHCSSITELYIPTTVKTIGASAFGAMTSLSKLTIPFIGGGKSSVVDSEVLGYVFNTVYTEFTTPLTQVITTTGQTRTYYIPTALKTIELIEGAVTSIKFGALSGITSVNTIIIPKSVIKFEEDAFKGSTGLLSISYRGSETDWVKISGRYTESNEAILSTIQIIYNYQ